MATTTIGYREPRGAILARIRAGFARLVGVLDDITNAHYCSHEIQRLMSLSDEELARQGLKRQEIVHHVFDRVMDHSRRG
ncbi:MAG: hypothetical protein AAF637_18505 [Pseudomonadota bacterium]